MFFDELLGKQYRYDEDEEGKSREIKPLGRDLSYVLASFLAYPKDEKHFTWDGEEIWPYSRSIQGIHIHAEYSAGYKKDLNTIPDEERKLSEDVTNAVREGVKDKSFTCYPWEAKLKLTVEGASVEMEDTTIKGFFCKPDWYFHGSKRAWAVAHTYVKKLEGTKLAEKYVIVPHVKEEFLSRRKGWGYWPVIKLVPKEEVPRFRSLLASLVDKVSRKPSPEEEIEGRIASLFEKL